MSYDVRAVLRPEERQCRRSRLRSVLRRRVGFWLLVGSAWSGHGIAQTSEPPPAPAPPTVSSTERPIVEIRVIGGGDTFEALRNTLGAHRLGKANLRWFESNTFAPQQILGLLPLAKVKIHCFIDLTDPLQARLYFVAPMHDRFMLREFDLPKHVGSFELESLAQIIEISVDVLLNDAEAGMSRREAQAVLAPSHEAQQVMSPPPSNAQNAVTYELAVAAHYALSTYSHAIPVVHGPGLGLYLERSTPETQRRLGLSMRYALPHRVKSETAGVDIDRIELGLELGQLFALSRSHRTFLGPSLQGGLGWVGSTPIVGARPGTYTLERSRHTIEGYVGLKLIGAVHLAKRLSTELSLGVTLVPKPVAHDFLVDGVRVPQNEGKLVRFGLELSLFVR